MLRISQFARSSDLASSFNRYHSNASFDLRKKVEVISNQLEKFGVFVPLERRSLREIEVIVHGRIGMFVGVGFGFGLSVAFLGIKEEIPSNSNLTKS